MSPQSAPVSPTLGEGIPREGMVGDNIVAGLRGDHCGPDGGPTRPRILGQVQSYSQEIMFTLSAVEQKYLGGHLLEYCWKC